MKKVYFSDLSWFKTILLSFLVASFTQSHAQLQAEYLFDGNGNSTSGGGAPAITLFGGTFYTPDRFSNNTAALTTDGSTGYAELLNGLNGMNSGSVSIWFKSNGGTSGLPILRKESATGGVSDFDITLSSSGILSFTAEYDSNNNQMVISHGNANLLGGSWHHIVATWSVTGKKMYVDGILVAQDTYGFYNDDTYDLRYL